MSYIARFVRTDKQPNEDYYYNDINAASEHLDAFITDTSGLYRNIALFDDKKNNVERILVFEDGKLRMDIRDGDIVRLRSGYRRPGEEQFLYEIKNINENMGRGLIVCINSKMSIAPAELVGLEMIDWVAQKP